MQDLDEKVKLLEKMQNVELAGEIDEEDEVVVVVEVEEEAHLDHLLVKPLPQLQKEEDEDLQLKSKMVKTGLK